jgi:membrane-associated phospholipid phosphatase
MGLALIAILWLDKPLALWVHSAGLDQWLVLRYVSEGVPVFLLVAVIGGCLVSSQLSHSYYLRLYTLVYYYAGLRLTIAIKTGLKIIFGRYWPKTWLNHNLSLISNGVYGFDWGQGFNNQGSFPSGHSSYTAYCIVVLCALLPRFTYLWLLILFILPLSLIILDYHFLGDCLAGVGLGVTSAWWLIKGHNPSYRYLASKFKRK